MLKHLTLAIFSHYGTPYFHRHFLYFNTQVAGLSRSCLGLYPKAIQLFKPPTAAYTHNNISDQILFKSPQLSSDQDVFNTTVYSADIPFIPPV
jgi:hypothetical protein